MSEHLRLESNLDGSGWSDMGLDLSNLSEGLRTIRQLRENGASERCMAGYRLLDPGGHVVLLLAPINLRISGARFKGTGYDPERSTV